MKSEYIPKIVQGVGATGFAAMAVGGEIMQALHRYGTMDYNWAVGHLSNIGASGAFTAAGLLAADVVTDKAKNKLLTALSVPAYLSIYEINQMTLGTGDPLDLACYWGAALTAIGVEKLSENLFKKNSPLEKLISATTF